MRNLLLPTVFCISMLCMGCSSTVPQESFRQPETSASGTTTNDLDAPNEKMPTTIDSLEPEELKKPLTITAISGGVLLGNPSAPMLTVFTDYDCEYCRQFSMSDIPLLEKTFIQQEKLSLQILFLPRTDVGNFMAMAAMCAARLNVFPSVDLAFSAEPMTSTNSFAVIAKKIGVDQKALASCMSEPKIISELADTKEHADSMGITRVPSFILEEKTWVGRKQQDELMRDIDMSLRR